MTAKIYSGPRSNAQAVHLGLALKVTYTYLCKESLKISCTVLNMILK